LSQRILLSMVWRSQSGLENAPFTGGACDI